jgi:hypothetical protein
LIHFVIPPVFEEPVQSIRRYCYYALAIAAIVAGIYVALVVTIDNTNLGTTNGLLKSPSVSAWEHGKEAAVDSGGFLYYPVYGTLARLIPDSVVQYGTPTLAPAFRKMALINALLGGIASGFVFFLALRFTRSFWTAGLVVIAHAGAGFVLLNSINSEDIIPAYTFFVAATAFFFEFLRSGRIWPYVTAAVFLALATLFHWTVMAPALAGFGAVFALVMTRKRLYFAAGAVWLFVFLCFLQALILVCLPRLHIPVWAIVYPGKADAGGWVGFDAEKLIYVCMGVGNYFSGGQNAVGYRFALQGAWLRMMILSWIYLLVTVGACLVTLFSKRALLGLKCLAVFAIALFAAGEFGATYSQPQDPQMQIEPMLATLLGLILLTRQLLGNATLWRRLLIGSLTVLMAINGAWNVHLFRENAGGDSIALSQIQEVGALFPRENTLLVSSPFAGWTSWEYVILWQGNSQGFLDHSFDLATPFTTIRGISGKSAADFTAKRIDNALTSGLRVITTGLWTQTPEEFSSSLTPVTTLEQARLYDAALRPRYRTGRKWHTALGWFVELLPA